MNTFEGESPLRVEEYALDLSPPLLETTEAMKGYIALPSLQQPHTLDGEQLVAYHHSLRQQIAWPHRARAGHLLAGAWCQVELAHIRDFEDQHAEAQELLTLASSQLDNIYATIRARHYANRPLDRLDYFYRTKLLEIYIPHFQQLGPVRWPESPTDSQRDAYANVQGRVLNPLLRDFTSSGKEHNTEALQVIAGLIGEVTVLQVLNRIQRTLNYPEWTVVPASARENSTDHALRNEVRRTFDLKLTFSDQTRVPIEVKWGEVSDAYDPSIAMIVVNQEGISGLQVAHAMRREVAGLPVLSQDTEQVNRITESTLAEIERVGLSGEGIYGHSGFEAAAAPLALGALVARAREQKKVKRLDLE